jgi:hypothetical protein
MCSHPSGVKERCIDLMSRSQSRTDGELSTLAKLYAMARSYKANGDTSWSSLLIFSMAFDKHAVMSANFLRALEL